MEGNWGKHLISASSFHKHTHTHVPTYMQTCIQTHIHSTQHAQAQNLKKNTSEWRQVVHEHRYFSLSLHSWLLCKPLPGQKGWAAWEANAASFHSGWKLGRAQSPPPAHPPLHGIPIQWDSKPRRLSGFDNFKISSQIWDDFMRKAYFIRIMLSFKMHL